MERRRMGNFTQRMQSAHRREEYERARVAVGS
jgi:hypothetical protein